MITKDNVRFFYKWDMIGSSHHVVVEYADPFGTLSAKSDSENWTKDFDADQHDRLCFQAFERLTSFIKKISSL
jgi:hypothetical protein